MKKLYVGNLPFNASEEQLQEWFSQVGVSPSAISLIRDRFTGQSRKHRCGRRRPITRRAGVDE